MARRAHRQRLSHSLPTLRGTTQHFIHRCSPRRGLQLTRAHLAEKHPHWPKHSRTPLAPVAQSILLSPPSLLRKLPPQSDKRQPAADDDAQESARPNRHGRRLTPSSFVLNRCDTALQWNKETRTEKPSTTASATSQHSAQPRTPTSGTFSASQDFDAGPQVAQRRTCSDAQHPGNPGREPSPLSDSNRRPPPYHGGFRAHARARPIPGRRRSPANRACLRTGGASRDVARVVSEVPTLSASRCFDRQRRPSDHKRVGSTGCAGSSSSSS
jgi:hypothetical protein